MKISGIIGSPRKGGNTDILVSQVLKGAVSKGGSQEKIYLDDLQIRPCKACRSCGPTGECIVKDDFHIILEKIKQSDAVVLGSPIYCGTVTAQTKTLIDRVESSQLIKSYTPDGRTKLFRRLNPDNVGQGFSLAKQGIIICVGDLSPNEVLEQAAEVIRTFLNDLGIKVIAEILENKLSEPGDAAQKKTLLSNAFRIGTSISK